MSTASLEQQFSTTGINDDGPSLVEADPQYPEVQGGGSLILAWQIRGRKVLVIGGGEVRRGPSPLSHFIFNSSFKLTIDIRLQQAVY
jgi:hypothetical protein